MALPGVVELIKRYRPMARKCRKHQGDFALFLKLYFQIFNAFLRLTGDSWEYLPLARRNETLYQIKKIVRRTFAPPKIVIPGLQQKINHATMLLLAELSFAQALRAKRHEILREYAEQKIECPDLKTVVEVFLEVLEPLLEECPDWLTLSAIDRHEFCQWLQMEVRYRSISEHKIDEAKWVRAELYVLKFIINEGYPRLATLLLDRF
jgi:hypothetical protein